MSISVILECNCHISVTVSLSVFASVPIEQDFFLFVFQGDDGRVGNQGKTAHIGKRVRISSCFCNRHAFDLTRYGFETLFLFPLKGKRGKTGDRGLRGMTGEKVSTESRPQENLTRLHIADAIRKTERLTFNTMLIYLPL